MQLHATDRRQNTILITNLLGCPFQFERPFGVRGALDYAMMRYVAVGIRASCAGSVTGHPFTLNISCFVRIGYALLSYIVAASVVDEDFVSVSYRLGGFQIDSLGIGN